MASLYAVHSARLAADAAELCGDLASAHEMRDLSGRLMAHVDATYVTPAGLVASDSPTSYAPALAFGALAADKVPDAGRPDLALDLLLWREVPSWLYPVTMGATTVWERWDSLLPDGSINPGDMTSFNHYALGSIAHFLHRRVAGLAPAAPGYRHITVAPLTDGPVTSATARHLTPFGPAEVFWVRDDGAVRMTVVIPPGTTAEVFVPGRAAPDHVGSGTWHFDSPRSATAPEAAARTGAPET